MSGDVYKRQFLMSDSDFLSGVHAHIKFLSKIGKLPSELTVLDTGRYPVNQQI